MTNEKHDGEVGAADRREKLEHGVSASSAEFGHYDQVTKPNYHLAEQEGGVEQFDEDFQVRTVDLRAWLGDDPAARAKFASELGAAMEEIGFAILIGHGVDSALFEEASGWVEEFFTGTSLKRKQAFRAARHGAVSEGYFPLETTSDIHPDQVEGWVFGRRAFHLHGDQDFDPAAHWPDPEFEALFRRLVAAQLPLVLPITRAILTYLDCDPHSFDERLSEPGFGLRLNYYPPMDSNPRAGRLLGHEDVDLFTFLPAPTVEGLQVLHRSGRWVRLQAPPGSIILNTGDYLQRLSNDRLPSTTHRVAQPRDRASAALPRVSFPLATYLHPDEVLECLPGLGPAKYPPIKVVTFHTRTTAKFYGDDYAVDVPLDSSES